MPLEKKVYLTFTGKEFHDEQEAINYESHVKRNGQEVLEELKNWILDQPGNPPEEEIIISLINSFNSEDKAWKLIRGFAWASAFLEDGLQSSDEDCSWIYGSY